MPAVISVETMPGITRLTRTPRRASSTANTCVSPASPAFDAPYAASPAKPRRPTTAPILTIDPSSLKYGKAARTQFRGPERLVSITSCQSPREREPISPPRCRPALLTRTSIPPQRSATCSQAPAKADGSVTSAITPIALSPIIRASFRTFSPRAKRATLSPLRAASLAIARPRPRDAPVTTHLRVPSFDCVVIAVLLRTID